MSQQDLHANRDWDGVPTRSQVRHGHTMGCVHDETGSCGSGCEPQDIDDPFVSRQQWGHGIARVPSHGLGFGWYNAVTRAHMAGLIGMGTPWDVFMMRRGRGAVVVSVKTSMVRSCPVNSGDMASLECRIMG